MPRLWQDLRYGLRMLGKNPGFTSAAVITLALGVGATTAIFSVVYGVLLRPLPYQHPEQIVRLWEQNDEGVRMNFADPNFEDMREQNRSLQGMAEYNALLETVSGAKEPTRTMISYVSRDLLQVMGVQPVLGRAFAPEEQRFDASIVALVSYSYWKQNLGATQELSSVRLRVGGRATSIERDKLFAIVLTFTLASMGTLPKSLSPALGLGASGVATQGRVGVGLFNDGPAVRRLSPPGIVTALFYRPVRESA